MNGYYDVRIFQADFAYEVLLLYDLSQSWNTFHFEVLTLYILIDYLSIKDRSSFVFFFFFSCIVKKVER